MRSTELFKFLCPRLPSIVPNNLLRKSTYCEFYPLQYWSSQSHKTVSEQHVLVVISIVCYPWISAFSWTLYLVWEPLLPIRQSPEYRPFSRLKSPPFRSLFSFSLLSIFEIWLMFSAFNARFSRKFTRVVSEIRNDKVARPLVRSCMQWRS